MHSDDVQYKKTEEAGHATAFIQLCYLCLLAVQTQIRLGSLEGWKWGFSYVAFLNRGEMKMQNLGYGSQV